MRNRFYLLAVLVLSCSLVLFTGCGDDDDNPAGPGDENGDTLTTEEILQEIGEVTGAFDPSEEECVPAYMLGAFTQTENLPELVFIGSALDSAAKLDGDLSPFYGTWEDTSSGVVPHMARTDDEPLGAVRVLLVGVDTTGATYPGDITIREYLVRDDSDTLSIDMAFHADGYTDSVSFLVEGTLDPATSSGLLKMWGVTCDVSFYLEATMTEQEGEGSVSGWYDYPDAPVVYFEVTGTIATDEEEEVDAEGTVHVWTTETPSVDVTMDVTTDPDTCMTGTVKINGVQEAEIVMVDCDQEDAALYLLIDGQQVDADELIGDLYAAIIGLDLDQIEEFLPE